MGFEQFGYYRIAAISPILTLRHPQENGEKIKTLARAPEAAGAAVLLFPELGLSGYTCEDLFHSSSLLEEVRHALHGLVRFSQEIPGVLVVGAPYRTPEGRLWNTAFVLHQGKLVGAIPKTHLPQYGEFYEARWFTSGQGVSMEVEDPLLGTFRLSSRQIFRIGALYFAVEICEDLWAPIPPSCDHALAGAQLILNLSASNELVGKADYRRDLVRQQSARLICAYALASCGVFESTKDIVYGSHTMIAENGIPLAEGPRFLFTDQITVQDIDIDKIVHDRAANKTFSDFRRDVPAYLIHALGIAPELPELQRVSSPYPFVPSTQGAVRERVTEILQIQSAGLARRIVAAHVKGVVLGISGGLDSTLALLICVRALRHLTRPCHQILAVSMPGLGTTAGTRESARQLAHALGVSFHEIPIHDAVRVHFRDIQHDEDTHDLVYENAQARERTQILFDLANQRESLLVGTGDLSELALGWCTYNADHMSSYHVNASVPRTLIKHLVRWIAEEEATPEVRQILLKVLDTPISPELLPPDALGNIQQKTEETLGPYEVHDFYLFHYVRNGYAPKKMLALAELAFTERYTLEELKRYLKTFLTRFHQQQFKRTCLPPGPKVGSVSLSPRGDWRMPDEIRLEWQV